MALVPRPSITSIEIARPELEQLLETAHESFRRGAGGDAQARAACAEHLRQAGFVVTVEDKPQAEMPRIKRWLNVPRALESVHTARVGPYFVEGHVPAEDVVQLLRERPRARGLAVPGLPRGAPGRENWSPQCETACTILADNPERELRREAFNTLLVGPDGKTSVFARH